MCQTINRITSTNWGILMTAEKNQAGAACRPPLPPGSSLTQRIHLGIFQSGEILMASHSGSVHKARLEGFGNAR